MTPEEVCYKGIIIAGPFFGKPQSFIAGLLIQVRKAAGAFGSDLTLIRLADGSLGSYENTPHWVPGPGIYAELEPELELVKHIDDPESEYTIAGEDPQIGFIVHGAAQLTEDPPFSIAIIKDRLHHQDDPGKVSMDTKEAARIFMDEQPDKVYIERHEAAGHTFVFKTGFPLDEEE